MKVQLHAVNIVDFRLSDARTGSYRAGRLAWLADDIGCCPGNLVWWGGREPIVYMDSGTPTMQPGQCGGCGTVRYPSHVIDSIHADRSMMVERVNREAER